MSLTATELRDRADALKALMLDTAVQQFQELQEAKQQIESLTAVLAEVRATLYAHTVGAVTAGANPQKDGTMSPPLYHVACTLCGARWSKTTWKREEAERAHPAHDDCLNAPEETP